MEWRTYWFVLIQRSFAKALAMHARDEALRKRETSPHSPHGVAHFDPIEFFFEAMERVIANLVVVAHL